MTVEQFADELGVKLGERFKASHDFHNDDSEVFYFDKGGLLIEEKDEQSNCHYDDYSLRLLVNGWYKIKKLPWKPKEGDEYWGVLMCGDTCQGCWSNRTQDFAMYYAGNCFETEKDAMEHAPEVIEKLKKKYEEGAVQ